MSYRYDEYLENHILNIKKGYWWMIIHIPDCIPEEIKTEYMQEILEAHDKSKYSAEEYKAYDEYFYGSNTSSYEAIERNFKSAWLHHIQANPHHWQHWVLINDDPDEGSIALDMPIENIIEMICDWWSFSWNTGNLYEIFEWYEEHKNNMILSENTRGTVEYILEKIKEVLDND